MFSKTEIKELIPTDMKIFLGKIYNNSSYAKVKNDFNYYKKAYSKEYNDNLIKNIRKYVEIMNICNCKYKFSTDINKESIYASTYACMLKGMLSDIDEKEKIEWKDYFDSYQREDGLFKENSCDVNVFFNGKDGFGARHLVPHIIIAYEYLGQKPKYEFSYLRKYEDPDDMIKMLKELDYKKIWGSSNVVMNYGIAMQYARDYMNMPFSRALDAMEDYLLKIIRKDYGIWLDGKIDNYSMYEAVRGAYHIYPILVYDGIEIPKALETLDFFCKTQNKWGGFNNCIISSACADIDAIDPIIRLAVQSKVKYEDIKTIIDLAERWVYFNQNKDGGFVFERNKEFCYGNQKILFSACNNSNLFATWFRSLSLRMIDDYKNNNNSLLDVPGYEFKVIK